MEYRLPTHGISTFPTHGISNPLSMVYRPPYPWYIDPLPLEYRPPIHGILTLLPMVYRPLPMVY